MALAPIDPRLPFTEGQLPAKCDWADSFRLLALPPKVAEKRRRF